MLKPVVSGLLAALLAAPVMAAEEGSGGMPQFDFERVAASQVFWLLLTFGILYVLMVLMLPSVSGVTEKRASTIGGDLDAADKARIDAEDRREAYEQAMAERRAEAQAAIAEAKAEAGKANEVKLAAADKDAAARMDVAMAELGAKKDEALAKVEAIAATATQDIVEKLTGARPDETRAASAVATAKA